MRFKKKKFVRVLLSIDHSYISAYIVIPPCSYTSSKGLKGLYF